MKIFSVVIFASTLIVSGCASVEMASQQESMKAKDFNKPNQGKAGLYVYRNSFGGKSLKKDVWVDGKCLGETANKVFFYTEVDGGKRHKIETESEFSPNSLELMMDTGKNYFVRQVIKMGAFVGGADLELVTDEQGKKHISKLKMAKSGHCSKDN